MSKRHGLLTALVAVALLLTACGPELATPTPRPESSDADSSPTAVRAGDTAEPEPEVPEDLPVDADDWHVLGSPDAPVTIIEYSDFQ